MRFCLSSRSSLLTCLPLLALLTLLSLLSTLSPATSHAQVVVPNSLAAQEGNHNSVALTNEAPRTYQAQIAASQLSGIAVGDQITSVRFRLNNASTPSRHDLIFPSYQVQLAQAAKSMGSFAANFANNMLNPVTVYNQSLTLPAASFTNTNSGTTPEAFGPTITFTTPYIYQGGDLVFYVTHGGQPGNNSASTALDAADDTTAGYGTDFRAQFATSQKASADAPTSFAVLQFTAVPEPGTVALAVSGLLPLAGVVMRRRRLRQRKA